MINECGRDEVWQLARGEAIQMQRIARMKVASRTMARDKNVVLANKEKPAIPEITFSILPVQLAQCCQQ